MGWLRDLMTTAAPPARSYGQLARRVLAHPAWDGLQAPQERSLAALFSKFDRGLELEWLADREHAMLAVAEALHCPAGDVRGAVQSALGRSARQARRFRFEEVRYARPLELLDEPLPPGIPAAVQTPQSWTRLWWVAPSGSGRTLTGMWLAARGLARFVSARSWTELRDAGPSQGAVFCELHSDPQSLPLTLFDGDRVCVAAPFPPSGPGWLVVKCEPILASLPAILEWLEDRLPQDGKFEGDAALSWFETSAAGAAIETLGDVLSIAGMMDEVGAGVLRGRDAQYLANHFIDFHLRRATQDGNADAQWLRKLGFTGITGLVRRCVTDSPLPLDAPRTEAEWVELMPPELQQGVGDVAWLRAALSADAPMATRELDRALKKAPPGAFRSARALMDAGLLREESPGGRLALVPAWVRRTARHAALQGVSRESSLEWGAALLQPQIAVDLSKHVSTEFSQRPEAWLEDVLDNVTEGSPASVAALEVAFRVVGLATLKGQSAATEAWEALASEQRSLRALTSVGMPTPRVPFPERAADCLCLSQGAWNWAYVLLDSRAAVEIPALPGAALEEFLDGLRDGMDALPSDDIYALQHATEKLRDLRDTLKGKVRDHTVFAGPALMDATQAPAWTVIETLAATPARLLGVRAALSKRWDDAASLIWRSWKQASYPKTTALLSIAALLTDLCEAAPEGCFGEVISVHPSALQSLPLEHASAAQWREVFACAAAHPAPLFAECIRRAAREMRSELSLEATINFTPHHWAALWNTAPERAAVLTRDLLILDLGRGLQSARLAPSAFLSQLVAAAGESVARGTAHTGSLAQLTDWLLECIRLRTAGWRGAYTLLVEVQARTKRLQTARGSV